MAARHARVYYSLADTILETTSGNSGGGKKEEEKKYENKIGRKTSYGIPARLKMADLNIITAWDTAMPFAIYFLWPRLPTRSFLFGLFGFPPRAHFSRQICSRARSS